jgi:hypothetical protein
MQFHEGLAVLWAKEILLSDQSLYGSYPDDRWLRGERHLVHMAHKEWALNHHKLLSQKILLRECRELMKSLEISTEFVDYSIFTRWMKLEEALEKELHVSPKALDQKL